MKIVPNLGLDSRHLTRSADGSILFHDGTVFLWSNARLNKLVSTDYVCFLCGRDKSLASFDKEHILPQWVIRDFDLGNERIKMPNGQLVDYFKYTVPSCVRCNSILSKHLENPTKKLIDYASDNPSKIFEHSNGKLLYTWLANLQLKIALKDFHWHWEQNPKFAEGSIALAADQDIASLLTAHSFVRSFFFSTRINPRAYGSLFRLNANSNMPRFHMIESTQDQCVFVKFGSVALYATFGDCGFSEMELNRFKTDGRYSNLQLIEIFARLATFQNSIAARPRFIQNFLPGDAAHLTLDCFFESGPHLSNFDREYFGSLFRRFLGPTMSLPWNGEIVSIAEIEEKILRGEVSYLFDENEQVAPATP